MHQGEARLIQHVIAEIAEQEIIAFAAEERILAAADHLIARKRCQKPLFTNSFFGRPRARNVAPKFHCVTIRSTHVGLPKGWPLVTLLRTVLNCSFVSPLFTQSG